MNQVNSIVIFIFLCCSFQLMAQNVGIGTTTPAAKLNVEGVPSNPSIPGTTSTGIFRMGVSNQEGIDFGKQNVSPFSAWMQAGFNGIAADPLAIQPLGGSVGMGTVMPHASAALDVTSTTQGLLPPRMTLAQRDAIATPAEGLMISCTDCSVKGLHQYINGAWQAMTSSNTGNYGTVTNPITGKTWLDRNLGATQVATSSTDIASYGDLYQWGRGADGHQKRNSSISGLAPLSWQPGTENFILNSRFIIVSSGNWHLATGDETDKLWAGTAAENNPCPSGFRVPTIAEWSQEAATWTSPSSIGAYDSLLKLPLAGIRDGQTGNVSGGFHYWSSTVRTESTARSISHIGDLRMNVFMKSSGLPLRCIKD